MPKQKITHTPQTYIKTHGIIGYFSEQRERVELRIAVETALEE